MFAFFDDLELPLKGVSELSVSYGANYASHNLIARKPKLQYVGLNSRQVTLSLRYDYSQGDVSAARKKLLDKARSHQAGTLALGSGLVLGVFVLESISESFRQTDGQGQPICIDYQATFKEYGQDNAAPKASPAVKKTAEAATSAAQQTTNLPNPPKVPGTAGAKTKATTAQEIVRQG